MMPVFVIEGKLHPCIEHSVFVHSRYDEAEVVNDGFIVCVHYISALSLLVSPRVKKFGGNMVVIIACHFSNKC